MREKQTPDEINAEATRMLSVGVFFVLVTIGVAILKNLVF